MSRNRKNIEYYRIPSTIESDFIVDQIQNFNVTNQGNVDAGTDRVIRNVLSGSDGNDAVNVDQLDTKVNLVGDVMTGDLDMGGNQLTNVGNPDSSDDAMSRLYADNRYVNLTGNTMTGALVVDSTILSTDNMEVSGSGKGLILESPNTSRWLITVTDAGTLSASAITESGNGYLRKINTDGDACASSAIRSYDKQTGSQGASTNTIFTIPFRYSVGTHTLFVYVNGQKAEYETTPPGDSGTVQYLMYEETDVSVVTFYCPLEDDDIVEFLVVGAYSGEVNDLTPTDLSEYKTRHATGTVGGVPATQFSTSQDMSNYRFTTLGVGYSDGHSVRRQQLGSYFLDAGASGTNEHYHISLRDSGGVERVQANPAYVRIVEQPLEIYSTVPTITMTDTTGHDMKLYLDGASVQMDGFNGSSWSNLMNIDIATKEVGVNGKITNVTDGTISSSSKEAVNGSQLHNQPSIERIQPVRIDTSFGGSGDAYVNVPHNGATSWYTGAIATPPTWATGAIIRFNLECDGTDATWNAAGNLDMQLYINSSGTTSCGIEQIAHLGDSGIGLNTLTVNGDAFVGYFGAGPYWIGYGIFSNISVTPVGGVNAMKLYHVGWWK
jgi:hypothetical protein